MPRAVLHVILNPKSGGGHGGQRYDDVLRELQARDVSAQVHMTQVSGHAVELAHDLACAGADVIAAAGGDGTMHDVANGILTAGTPTAMGVIPLGTGNDFAKIVPGASKRPFDTLARPSVALFDVGHATWDGGSEYFVNGMGSGIDVEVVRQLHRAPQLPGPIKYLFALLRALAVYKPIALTAIANDEILARSIMMMAVGNGICQGGGFYLTPQASPLDGRLDLCVIDALPLWKVPVVLPRVLRGSHGRHSAVTMRAVERVRFESHGPPLYFQLDGELREPPRASWLNVEVRRAALRVVVATEMDK
jgi:YegS/Rv2252/BmrU family lipid kinase